MVSVTSLAILLGLEDRRKNLPATSRLIVIAHESVVTALLVDSVESIVDFEDSKMQKVGTIEVGARVATSEILSGSELLLLLSTEKILVSDEMVVDFRG